MSHKLASRTIVDWCWIQQLNLACTSTTMKKFSTKQSRRLAFLGNLIYKNHQVGDDPSLVRNGILLLIHRFFIFSQSLYSDPDPATESQLPTFMSLFIRLEQPKYHINRLNRGLCICQPINDGLISARITKKQIFVNIFVPSR